MEIFAQWLDDVDDLVMALPLIWGRVRRRCLDLGLLAALTLGTAGTAGPPAWVVTGASVLAAGSVSLWLAAFVTTILRRPFTRSA